MSEIDKEKLERIEECREMADDIYVSTYQIDNCLELTDEIDAGTNATIANLLSLIRLVRKEAGAASTKASELEAKLGKLQKE